MIENPPANAGDVRIVGSIPGLGRSPGGGPGKPLQYSCLENPTDRGACWATVHGVAKKCLVGYSPWSRKESDTACRGDECLSQFSVPAPLSLGPSLTSAPFLSHLCFKMASSLVYLYRPGRGQEEGSAQSLQHLAQSSVAFWRDPGKASWSTCECTSPAHLGPGAPQLDAGGGCTRQCPAAAATARHPRWQ